VPARLPALVARTRPASLAYGLYAVLSRSLSKG